MMFRESLIRAVVMCFMTAGLAYVSAGVAAAEMAGDCSDLDFEACMQEWPCNEEQDCQDGLAMAGPEYDHCVVDEAHCGFSMFPPCSRYLTCTYTDDL